MSDIINSMTEKNLIKTFVNKADFTNQGIDEFLKSMNLNKNKLVLIVFNELSNMSDRLSKSDLKSNLYFYKLIKLVTILVNDCNFNQEEAAKIKLKNKTVREKLLSAYGDTYIKAVNTLDELVVDKNDDIDSLFIIIKELINRCEDTNIIKKFVTSNKEVLNRNNCELFDIAFNKALKALKKENEDIYYYITLLKIFYSSNIDKQKYYKLLDSYKGKNNLFLRQMYMIIQGIKRSLSLEEINDKYEITIYASCMNLNEGIYYYKTYDNPQISAVYLKNENLNSSKLISYDLAKESIFNQN